MKVRKEQPKRIKGMPKRMTLDEKHDGIPKSVYDKAQAHADHEKYKKFGLRVGAVGDGIIKYSLLLWLLKELAEWLSIF